jgi:chemotaxis signal transduction protein/HPt (histidine-containing phosphotransfer) domain-containing protein
MSEFDDIIPEYIAESQELLQEVESGLLAMESGQVEEEAIHTVFRAIHSIKGGAGFVGLTKIERLAHKMEDLLNLIRNGDLKATQPVTDALLQSLDVLTALFQRAGDDQDIDIEAPLKALEAALNAETAPELRRGLDPVELSGAAEGLPAFEVSSYALANKLGQGNLYHLHLDLSRIEARGLTPIQLVNEMLSMGEILDSQVNLPETADLASEPAPPSFDVLYATVLEPDLLEAALHLDSEEHRLVTAADFGLEEPAEESPAPEPAPAAAPEPEAPAAQPAPAQAQAQPAPAQAPAEAQAPAVRPAPPPSPAAAPPPEPEPPRLGGEYLTFTLGSENYGVDILGVQEIIALPPITKLPRAPEHVLGVMNLRGMVVPVLDLRLRLGLEPSEEEQVVAVLLVRDQYVGAVVDSVSDVIQVGEEEVQEAPEFASQLDRSYLRGLLNRQGELIVLLELDRILAHEATGRAA